MIVLVAHPRAESLQQGIDFRFVAGDEGPAGTSLKLFGKVSQTLRCVDCRVDANRNEFYIRVGILELDLNTTERRTQHGTHGCTGSEDEVYGDVTTLDEIAVKIQRVTVLV